MLKGIKFTDRIKVPTQRQFTDSGQMIVPCTFARTGEQIYPAIALKIADAKAEDTVVVLRDEADVFADESVSSFRSVPVTLGHPKDDKGMNIEVNATNAGDLQVGVLEGMPTRDENKLGGNLVIARQDAIDEIENGTVELSAGYTCDIEMVVDEAGVNQYFQRNIRANHIAIVEKGRAGSSVRIADEAEVLETVKPKVDIEVEKPDADAEKLIADEAAAEKLVADELAAKEVTVADELVLAQTENATLTVKLNLADAKVVELTDTLEANVADKVEVVLKAIELTDMTDFSGKTVMEIRAMVVADIMPTLNLEGKDDAYVTACYDMLCTDATSESPMSKLLRKEIVAVKVLDSATAKDPVKVARQKMIDRQKTQSV